jgi:peptide methionine sulfoxide reductase msrA/msrB
VIKVISGYTGGNKEDPTNEEVSSGTTGHVEAIQVYYDPSKLTYEELLDFFWGHINPTEPSGQFVDRGKQYRSVIFYHDEEQKRLAEKAKEALARSRRRITRTTTKRILSGINIIGMRPAAISF